MNTLVTVLLIIVGVLLILIVLVQNSKGGGLASNFSSSNQIMGVRKTADFLEKATWTLAILILVFSIVGSLTITKADAPKESVIDEQVQNAGEIPTLPKLQQSQQTGAEENTQN